MCDALQGRCSRLQCISINIRRLQRRLLLPWFKPLNERRLGPYRKAVFRLLYSHIIRDKSSTHFGVVVMMGFIFHGLHPWLLKGSTLFGVVFEKLTMVQIFSAAETWTIKESSLRIAVFSYYP